MKTRSNMPLFVVECTDVKALTKDQIDLLRCGDYLVKKDSSGEHAYKVTFKKEGVGMCLTYTDASVVETQSYDYVDGAWVYNSEDKTPLKTEGELKTFIEDTLIAEQEGTPVKVLGINGDDELCQGTISVGTKLYKHNWSISGGVMVGISIDGTAITTISNLKSAFTTTAKTMLSLVVFIGNDQLLSNVVAIKDSIYYYKQDGTLTSIAMPTGTDTVTPL